MKKLCMIAMLLIAAINAYSASPASVSKPANGAHKSHAAQAASAAPQVLPRFRFENFTTANGLPNNHVFAVLVDGDRIWAGTENGLAVYENHVWKVYRSEERLAGKQ